MSTAAGGEVGGPLTRTISNDGLLFSKSWLPVNISVLSFSIFNFSSAVMMLTVIDDGGIMIILCEDCDSVMFECSATAAVVAAAAATGLDLDRTARVC